MAEEKTPSGFTEPRSDVPMQEIEVLDGALDQARAEYNAMAQAASTADATGASNDRYTMHEVPGVGRFIVPHQGGWVPLITLINDRAVDIDFSLTGYPSFDAIIDDHFDAAPLADPLDDDYESFKSLRDNIAAVRNFLMQTYYVNTPKGMTPEKARVALEQIAAYVGDGMYNNLRLFGVIPNHNPTKPFISTAEARKPDGRGAQYIYEKILEMQRHNNWLRPFDAVVALFGGKPNIDWKLPNADATPFRDHYAEGVAPPPKNAVPTAADLAAQQRYIQSLETRRAQLKQSTLLTMMAVDLDAIGNHLLYTSDNLNGIASVSEPVRREAVEIAKDILRKLKLAIGNLNILDGLKLKPADDMATLGAIKGVAMVYERMVAWARGIDPTIMQHPSVMAATRAIGQLGYLSKLEALRMAKLAGNGPLADKLKAQLARIPPYFSEATDAHFGSLLDKVERGIDTVMNRTHEVNGPNAMVGHKPAKDISAFMSGTPIAGQSMLISAEASSNRNKQQAMIIEAQDMAERAQAQRIQAQVAQRTQQNSQQQQAQARHRTGRQQLQQAQRQQSSSSSLSNPAISNPGLTQAQRMAAQRNAWMASQHHDEHEDPHHSPKTVAQKIDPSIIMGFRSATNLAGVNGPMVATNRAAYETQMRAAMQNARVTQPAPQQNRQQQTTNAAKTEADRLRLQQQQLQAQANTPPKGRGGPGF